jgi:CMP-N-acetylneuraminic acid synthetase
LLSDLAAVVLAKGKSRRVPDKNFRPFFKGMSLVECKVLRLQALGLGTIKISSDDPRAERLAARMSVDFEHRPTRFCGDVTQVADWVNFSVSGWEERIVYWAFPTAPFVSASSIAKAVETTASADQGCTLGVQVLKEFLWGEDGPLNYDPTIMPRSQDLDPIYRITGGIHMAWGHAFLEAGAFAFGPPAFLPLPLVECMDINTEEEWALAAELAPSVLRDL